MAMVSIHLVGKLILCNIVQNQGHPMFSSSPAIIFDKRVVVKGSVLNPKINPTSKDIFSPHSRASEHFGNSDNPGGSPGDLDIPHVADLNEPMNKKNNHLTT